MALNDTALNEVGLNEVGGATGPAAPSGYVYIVDAALVRYRFVLEGDTNVTIPISSFQARMNAATPTYLSVTVPAILDYVDDLEDRAGDEMVIYRTSYDVAGNVLEDAELIRVTYETLRLDVGGRSQSGTLVGHADLENPTPTYVYLGGVSYYAVYADGTSHYRCKPNTQLRPGDTAIIGEDETEMVVDTISYAVNAQTELMEIGDAV